MEETASENLAELEKCYRLTALIVGAPILLTLVLTIVLTVVNLFVFPRTESRLSPETIQTLWIVIVFLAVGTFILRRMFFRWERLRDIALLKGVKGLLGTLQTNAIILAASAQMVFVIGLFVALWSGDGFDILRAGIVALILLAINFPRKSVWKKIVTSLEEV